MRTNIKHKHLIGYHYTNIKDNHQTENKEIHRNKANRHAHKHTKTRIKIVILWFSICIPFIHKRGTLRSHAVLVLACVCVRVCVYSGFDSITVLCVKCATNEMQTAWLPITIIKTTTKYSEKKTTESVFIFWWNGERIHQTWSWLKCKRKTDKKKTDQPTKKIFFLLWLTVNV